jgi:NADPH:quinone reductase-like Zn-dependent oxidoreductase
MIDRWTCPPGLKSGDWSGQYLEEPKLPARLGHEAAGTVAAIGPGVQGLKLGDAVSIIPAFSLNAYGLYGELANAPVHAVIHHPASPTEA